MTGKTVKLEWPVCVAFMGICSKSLKNAFQAQAEDMGLQACTGAVPGVDALFSHMEGERTEITGLDLKLDMTIHTWAMVMGTARQALTRMQAVPL